ncbi:unnamed protein product [Mytilus coruscus]|uniref:VWFA domain-containing protein n=1 Tax=Mytilus coruscus TaxID=42192 RepID=A0A6J8AFM2_MYTCO|nr:unnamed protein product [Mytilus coruscus]
MECHGLIILVSLMSIWSVDSVSAKKRVDCQMSSWSMWSQIYGFGVRSKERTILRCPDNGGRSCPRREKIQYTSKKPTIQETANQIVTSFLQRNLKTTSLSNNIYVRRNIPVGLFRDLLIIIDSSGSVGANNFKIAKQQVAELLGLLCPRPDPFNVNSNNGYNRAALIQFASYVVEEFDFTANKNLAQLKVSINSIRYRGGSTCTGDAFEKAIQMFTSSKGSRHGTKHEVLILTDGQSNCGKHLSTVLPRLHAKATVFGLMIGRFSSRGKRELTSYVSKPIPDHLFAVENYHDLKKLLKLIKAKIGTSSPCAPFDL